MSVALRKESVDRNIRRCLMSVVFLLVALRKESVDRNSIFPLFRLNSQVALRKESVDRNVSTATTPTSSASRSPQGERG